MQGIDLFDMAYLADVTEAGYALAFPLSPEDEARQQQQQQAAQAVAHQQNQRQNGTAAAVVEGAAAAVAAAAQAIADDDSEGRDDSKVNLWALSYRTDKRPLLPGCSCFACANHTRAYVHHLLQSHEMTAQVGCLDSWTKALGW